MPRKPALPSLFGALRILPRRLYLDQLTQTATVPMIRGTFGAALHELDFALYQRVFQGDQGRREPCPWYVLRPAQRFGAVPAIEWISLQGALNEDQDLRRAMEDVQHRGLGPGRRPFRISAWRALEPDGSESDDPQPRGWPLDQAQWPFTGNPAQTPLRLCFPAPLRLLRNQRLIERPSLADIVVALSRRIEALAPDSDMAGCQPLLLDLARRIPQRPFVGERLDLMRYSARQRCELDLHGVTGNLDLPEGPGALWPWLLAATWLHMGKSTVVGLGQMVLQTITESSATDSRGSADDPTRRRR